ncbi:MAG: hypothetical protein AAGI01_06900, partial [Myxococcota bacterium]
MKQREICLMRRFLWIATVSLAVGCSSNEAQAPRERAAKKQALKVKKQALKTAPEEVSPSTRQASATPNLTTSSRPSHQPEREHATLYSFDQLDDHARASVLALGLDVILRDDGSVTLLRAKHMGADGEVRRASRHYTLENMRVGLEGMLSEQGAPVRTTIEGERLTRTYASGVVEHYDHLRRGLEQTIVVPELLGSGDLIVQYDVRTQLESTTSTDGQSVSVRNELGDEFVWRDLIVKDATGKLLSARMEGTKTSLAYRVDVAGAEFPITVDPLST